MFFYYTSQNPTAPQIKNQWGDLNTIINYVLDGGQSFDIDRIEWFKQGYVKVYYSGEQCVYNYETVTFTGSGDHDDKKFFVENVNPVEKYFIAKNSTISAITFGDINNINMKVKIVPCGAKRKFGGVADKRTVIRFDDKFDIRIDDRDIGSLFIPPIAWHRDAHKFIRICGAESFDTLDYTQSRQMPYNPTKSNLNFLPTNDRYVSENIFIYNSRIIERNLEDQKATNGLIWRIWANDKAMYIQVESPFDNTFICGFGTYDCYSKDLNNGFIYSMRTLSPTNSSSSSSSSSIYVNTMGTFGSDYRKEMYTQYNNHLLHAMIYDNGTNQYQYYRQQSEFGQFPSLSAGEGGVDIVNMNDNVILHSGIILTEFNNGSEYFGQYYGLRWINTRINLMSDYIYQDKNNGKTYITMKSHHRETKTTVIFVELYNE